MANKTTRPVTVEEYKEIIAALENGIEEARISPKPKTAMILCSIAYLGLRVSDVLLLTIGSFSMRDDGKIILYIKEKKTKKKRSFPVPQKYYLALMDYCRKAGVTEDDEYIFAGKKPGTHVTERSVQKTLQQVVNYLGISGNISTHSFRKMFATTIYQQNHDILLVQTILKHASASTTRNYIGISPEDIESTLESVSY